MDTNKSKLRLRFGGDYNPEQWPAEMLERDVRLMTEAGVNTVTLNVFGWGMIQPEEERYDFSLLDAVFDSLERSGIDIVLATPTAAPPAWMFQKEPTMLKVGEDGMRAVHWSRQAYCPNHPLYNREIRKMAAALAERYGRRSNLILWHINNEYIIHCYCGNCAARFREWLQIRYGSLERLNEAWQLSQWSLQRTDWQQITPPLGGMAHTSHSLDYQRFLSDSSLNNFLAEKEEIVRITPEIPVTTNFYSLDFQGQIHHQWAPHLDVIAWDSYPPHKDHAVWAAFQHDYFRSMKRKPFMLMEQATGSVNWKAYNPAKRPGMMRLQSYQALARGAEAVMFFQIRQSRGGVEKFHSSLVSHGTETENRIYREVNRLGRELQAMGDIGQGSIRARTAVLFDMTLTWLVDWNKASLDIAYRETVTAFYRPLYEANIPVDVVHPLADLNSYEIVVAPMLYMFEAGVPEQLRRFVERGGKLVMSYMSGMVNGCDVVENGGFLRFRMYSEFPLRNGMRSSRKCPTGSLGMTGERRQARSCRSRTKLRNGR
ncbi:beta-galactosidase, partial [Paenibacillus sepulcri]|nr:beta-galactosidase [Paenibacillus sepulcri]